LVISAFVWGLNGKVLSNNIESKKGLRNRRPFFVYKKNSK